MRVRRYYGQETDQQSIRQTRKKPIIDLHREQFFSSKKGHIVTPKFQLRLRYMFWIIFVCILEMLHKDNLLTKQSFLRIVMFGYYRKCGFQCLKI